jgi:nucleoside-diphosphate-sugar epimerase
MRILITGGSGFIGTNAVERFLQLGAVVSSIDNTPPKNPDHRAVFTEVDLLNSELLRDHVRDFDPTHVLHLGARTDLDGKSIDAYEANTVGLVNLMEAMEGTAVSRVIFASSRLVCEIGYTPKDVFDVCPTTAYGESKVEGERIVRDAAPLPYTRTIVRPTSIWGPWFGVPYRTFFDSVLSGRYVHPGSRRIRKSFGYVGNTVFELERILEAPAEAVHEKTFYLADTPPIEVLGFANAIRARAGKGPVRRAPRAALRILASIGDLGERLTNRAMPLTSFRLANLETEMIYDIEDLAAVVGDLPFTVDQGIETTLEWLESESG